MNRLLEQIEPLAAGNAEVDARNPPNELIQLSIAISLRRIADAITGSGDTAQVTILIEHLAWSAGRSFEQGRRTDR